MSQSQFSFPSAAQTEPSSSPYGTGEGPILLDDVKCSGDESSLLQCDKSPLAAGTDCKHTEDVAITCQGSNGCMTHWFTGHSSLWIDTVNVFQCISICFLCVYMFHFNAIYSYLGLDRMRWLHHHFRITSWLHIQKCIYVLIFSLHLQPTIFITSLLNVSVVLFNFVGTLSFVIHLESHKIL